MKNKGLIAFLGACVFSITCYADGKLHTKDVFKYEDFRKPVAPVVKRKTRTLTELIADYKVETLPESEVKKALQEVRDAVVHSTYASRNADPKYAEKVGTVDDLQRGCAQAMSFLGYQLEKWPSSPEKTLCLINDSLSQ
jgi:hypothetical protein